MKNECNIIRDILPLYAEKMVSNDTAEFVRKHLEICPACRAELEKMKEPVQPEPDIDAAPLKRLKKTLLVKKVKTILCTIAVLLALMLSAFAFLTAPEFFTYSPDLVTVTDADNAAVTISFSEKITNYSLQRITNPDQDQVVYHLEVWSSKWDKMFEKHGIQNAVIEPVNSDPIIIYFTQYNMQGNDAESVCIYGTPSPEEGGWVVLPGLSLGYWLILNAGLFVLFGAAWLLFRKKQRVRKWMERLILIPVAYVLGHFCVLRFSTVSYSEMRDFQLILAIGILFYCAMLLALSIFRARKERKDAEGKL